MGKYMLLYRGPANATQSPSPEQIAEETRAWEDWMARVGTAMVEFGAPFGERTAFSDNGRTRVPSDQNGYSIVAADNLDAARDLLKGHPFLTEGKGRFVVEIFELRPM